MEKDLAEGIKRVAQALNKHEVEYMFVGGVAISFYGNPRPSTNLPKDVEYDIDVWYQALSGAIASSCSSLGTNFFSIQ